MRSSDSIGHAASGEAETGRREDRSRSGFTLIELAVAISILMIGLVSIVSTTSRMHALRKNNRERNLAQNAARSIAERIHARSYQYSSDPDSWAQEVIDDFSSGGTYGDTFDVRGLNVPVGETVVGTITIVSDETTTDAALGYQVGLPRDLNGDGAADSLDVSGDARILPVLIRVQWRGQNGLNEHTHAFYLMGY